MKYLFLLPILFTSFVKGQDIITLKNGDQIKCRIVEVDTDKIKYKLFGLNDSTVYNIKKSNESNIYFHPAGEDLSASGVNKGGPMTKQDSINYYWHGVDDAKRYYGSLPVGGGTAVFYVSLFFGGLGGLIPAVACSSTPPQEKNLHLPLTAMKDNNGYMTGYRRQAYRIKRGKVWLNFAIGAVMGTTIAVLLSNLK